MSGLVSMIRKVKRELSIKEKIIFYMNADGVNRCYDCNNGIIGVTEAHYNAKGIVDICPNFYCPKCNIEEVPKILYEKTIYGDLKQRFSCIINILL